MRAQRDLRPLPGQHGADQGGNQPTFIVAGTIGGKDAAPGVAHSRLRGELARQEKRRQLGRAIQRGGLGQGIFAHGLDAAILALATDPDKGCGAACPRRLDKGTGRIQIFRNLAPLEAGTVGHAPPGEVDDAFGTESRDRRGNTIAVSQINFNAAITIFQGHKTHRRASGAHRGRNLMAVRQQGLESRGADESGGACQEYLHNSAAA